MKNKPMLEDYGLNEDDWEIYSASKEIRELRQKTSLWIMILLKVSFGICMVILVSICAKIFVCIASNYQIRIESWQEVIKIPQLIGFSIGFAFWGYLDYKRKLKKIDKEADKVMESLSAKKIEMLHKYKKALDEYETTIKNEERKLKEKEGKIKKIKEDIKYDKSLLELIDKEIIDNYNSEELKRLIESLFDSYLPCIEEMFDFESINSLIKCVGIDSFISKIEIKEMNDFFLKNKEKEIIIYSLVDVDEKLIKNLPHIKLIKKEEIKGIYKDFINNEIKELDEELNKLENELFNLKCNYKKIT